MTTYFVGAHYELTGAVVTKYYFAGSQRIAMRKGAILTYMLSDHLGSTSLTTDSAGNVISELRYKPWGELRYQAGTTSTSYTYTGQYSNTADFGLMYYNARWYDPSLGRFAQADSIVPGGVQGYDRYAYVNNNPIKYTDPTGHSTWDGSNEGGGSGHSTCDLDCWRAKNQGDDDGGGGGGDNPPGHEYSAFTLVCPAVFKCTEDEMKEYMTRFQYPGQWPWSPVSDGLDAIVAPARFLNIPNPLFYYGGNQGLGAITVDITNNGRTIINRSQPSHIFHNGIVERTLVNSEKGWHISTHGTGTNIRTSYPVVNHAIDAMNTAIGDEAFAYGTDLPMYLYIVADQSIQDVGSYVSNWLP